MSASLIARRYASAFCELAREEGRLDEAVAALGQVQEAFEPAMEPIFRNPEVPKSRRKQVVQGVLGGRDVPLIYRFCMILVEKDRFDLLETIVEACRAEADRLNNRKRAQVRTAFPMDEARREKLKQKLGERFDAEIVIDEREEPDLIGGLQVKIEDYLMDNSIAHQLERLHGRFQTNAN